MVCITEVSKIVKIIKHGALDVLSNRGENTMGMAEGHRLLVASYHSLTFFLHVKVNYVLIYLNSLYT